MHEVQVGDELAQWKVMEQLATELLFPCCHCSHCGSHDTVPHPPSWEAVTTVNFWPQPARHEVWLHKLGTCRQCQTQFEVNPVFYGYTVTSGTSSVWFQVTAMVRRTTSLVFADTDVVVGEVVDVQGKDDRHVVHCCTGALFLTN